MVNIPVEPAITEFLHRKATLQRLPLNGSFELTPLCNMNCRMCYVRISKEEQEAIRPLHTAEEWLALGKAARDSGMLYLLLTGGEPFSRPDFREILSGLHRMGLLITVNSNGTLIDEKTVEWLKETPPVRINITLYGASDETYGRLCRNPKGFTQVCRALELLRKAGISVRLNCSVTPHNGQDLEEMMAFAKREGLLIQATSYMFPPLRRAPDQIGRNDRFSPEEAAYYSAKIESLLNGEDDYLERMKTRNLDGLCGEVGEDCSDTVGDGIRCRAGKCSFWVTWEGKLMPCGMMPGTGAKNVFESGFQEAWKAAVQESDAIRLPAKCSKCGLRQLCKACAAMVYTESGNYHQVPEYRCAMAHAYPDACRQVEREILERRACITQGQEKA